MKSELTVRLAARLSALRAARGWTLDQLAAASGVSRAALSRLENAEVTDPGVDLMRRIAGELGVTLSLATENKLRAVTIALPEDVCERLASGDGGEILDAMVRAARHPT